MPANLLTFAGALTMLEYRTGPELVNARALTGYGDGIVCHNRLGAGREQVVGESAP
jgi:hypothetical protein